MNYAKSKDFKQYGKYAKMNEHFKFKDKYKIKQCSYDMLQIEIEIKEDKNEISSK